MTKSRKRGFTLVELLVVIAIIGILAALGLGVFTTSRRAARDSRRLGDVKEMMTALEQSFNENASYPASISALTGSLLDRAPVDPRNTGCWIYAYTQTGSGTGYTLQYGLEKANDSQAVGTNITVAACVSPAQAYRVTR